MFLARDSDAGATFIHVDHLRCGLSPSDSMILGNEVITVADVAEDGNEILTLMAPLENGHPDGTEVVPISPPSPPTSPALLPSPAPAPSNLPPSAPASNPASGSSDLALLGLLALLLLLVPACYLTYKTCAAPGFSVHIVDGIPVPGIKKAPKLCSIARLPPHHDRPVLCAQGRIQFKEKSEPRTPPRKRAKSLAHLYDQPRQFTGPALCDRPRQRGPTGTPLGLSPHFAENRQLAKPYRVLVLTSQPSPHPSASRLTDYTDSTVASPRGTASGHSTPFSTPMTSPRPTESE